MAETESNYEEWSLEDLKEEIRSRNEAGSDLRVSGNKDELAARLELNDLSQSDDEESQGGEMQSESDGGDADADSADAAEEGGAATAAADPEEDGTTAAAVAEEGDAEGSGRAGPVAPEIPTTSPSDAEGARVHDATLSDPDGDEEAGAVAAEEPVEDKLHPGAPGAPMAERRERLTEVGDTSVPEVEVARSTLPQEGPDVPGAFQHAVGPDGTHRPLARTTTEDADDEE